MLSCQTFVTFPSLSDLLSLCCFLNFSRLIKPLSSYQTCVIFSSFVIYSHFALSTHPLNAPAVHTTNTILSLLSYRAPSLCANTPLLLKAAIRAFAMRWRRLTCYLENLRTFHSSPQTMRMGLYQIQKTFCI